MSTSVFESFQLSPSIFNSNRALKLHPSHTQALVRRSAAFQALGKFRLAVEDLTAAEASVVTSMGSKGGASDGQDASVAEELLDVRTRLEHARWTKVCRFFDSD